MAGAATIGALRVVLGLDTAQFTAGLTAAQKELKKAGAQMQRFGEGLAGIGAGLSVAVTAPMVALGVASLKAAKDVNVAAGQVNAALKSMGGASGKTADELKKSAAQLQALSTFDDDEILQKVTANLLTFGKVSGEAFDRAQLAIVNLATRLSMDLQPATLLVGKALNDPVKGLAALSRAGIQFTADQREMIKGMVDMGDVAGAQKMILSELERQFGGSAKAMRDATPDADLIDAWRNFQEVVGAMALKVLPPLTRALTNVLNAFNDLSPAAQTTVGVLAAVAAGVGPVVVVIGTLVSTVAGLATAMGGFSVIATALLGPLGLVAGALAAVAAAVIYLNVQQGKLDAANRQVIQNLGGAKGALDDFQVAAGQAATASKEAKKQALEHAEAMRQEAYAAVGAAKALRDKAVAAAQAAADEAQRARDTSDPRTMSGFAMAMGNVGGATPLGIDPTTAMQGRFMKSAEDAKARAKAATEAAAAAEQRYAQILQSMTAPALKATGDGADAAGAAIGRLGRATKDTAKATDDLGDALQRVFERNMTAGERRSQQIAEDLATLRKGFDAGRISAAQYHAEIAKMDGADAVHQQSVQINADLVTMQESIGDFGKTVEMSSEDMQNALEGVANSVDNVFWSLKNHDWVGALSGMSNALKSLQALSAGSGGQGSSLLSSASALLTKIAPIVTAATVVYQVGSQLSQGIVAAFGGDKRQQKNAKNWGGLFGTVGGLIAAVVGGKESNHGALATIQGDSFSLSGDKRNDETTKLANAAAQAILDGQKLLRDAGVKLAATVTSIDIGTRDATDIILSDGRSLTSAVGDAGAAAETALKGLLQGAGYATDAQRTMVDAMLAAGKGFDDILATLDTFKQVNEIPKTIADAILKLTDPQAYDVSQLKAEQAARRASIADYAAQGFLTADQLSSINDQLARLEGLELDDVMKRFADSVDATHSSLLSEVDDARSQLAAAYDQVVSTLNSRMEQFKALGDSLTAYRRSLDAEAAATPADRYGALQTEFNRVAGLAQLGNTDAMSAFQNVADQFRDASKSTARTQVDYQRDLSRIKAAAEKAGDTAYRQVDIAQQQLNAATAQVAGLIEVNRSVLSVGDAIANLGKALDTYQSKTGQSLGANPSANAALAAATGYKGAFGSGGFQEWIVQQGESVKAAARKVLEAFGQGYRISGFKDGGEFMVGGAGGVDSQLMQFRATPGEMVSISHGDSLGALAGEVRNLAQEMRSANAAIAMNTSQTAKILRRWDGDGQPPERVAA